MLGGYFEAPELENKTRTTSPYKSFRAQDTDLPVIQNFFPVLYPAMQFRSSLIPRILLPAALGTRSSLYNHLDARNIGLSRDDFTGDLLTRMASARDNGIYPAYKSSLGSEAYHRREYDDLKALERREATPSDLLEVAARQAERDVARWLTDTKEVRDAARHMELRLRTPGDNLHTQDLS